MKNLVFLFVMAVLVGCNAGQNLSIQTTDDLTTNQDSKINPNVEAGAATNAQAERLTPDYDGPMWSGAASLAEHPIPKFIPYGLPIEDWPVPSMVAGALGSQVTVTIQAMVGGDAVKLAKVVVTGKTLISDLRVDVPAFASSIKARVVAGGLPPHHPTGPMGIGTLNHKMGASNSAGSVDSITYCNITEPCDDDDDDNGPTVGQEDYCLAAALYFQDTDVAVFDKEVGESNENVFAAVVDAPAVDPWTSGITMPIIAPTVGCEFDGLFPHASNQFGWTGIQNIGEGAGQMDAFDNLTAPRPNPKHGGALETPLDDYTGPDGLGNLINEGLYFNTKPVDLRTRALDFYITDHGRPLVLLSAGNPGKGYGGYLLNIYGIDDNGDGIREFSYVKSLQENIGELTSGGVLLYSASTDLQTIRLPRQNAGELPYKLIIAAGDHDTSVNPDANPGEQSSAFDNFGGMELGLDAAIVEPIVDFPGVKHVRKTAEIFKRHDGSDFEGAYDLGGFYGTVENSVRLYMSKVAICSDIKGHPLYFFGISEANDVHFNRSVVPQSPAVLESGFAAVYDQDAGEYGQFIEIDDVAVNTKGIKLDDLGLETFLSDAQNARDIKCERNFLKDVVVDMGLPVPDVADAHLVIANIDGPIDVWEFREDATPQFRKITGVQPDTIAGSAHMINTRLKSGGTIDTANWEIPQSAIGATPNNQAGGVAEANSMIEVDSGVFDAAGSTMHLQHPTLSTANATFFTLFLTRRYDDNGEVVRYDPMILTGCASDDDVCSQLDKSKLRAYIQDDTP